MKVKQLYDLQEGLAYLYNQDFKYDVAIKIQRNVNILKKEIEVIEPLRQKIIMECIDEDGIKIKKSKESICNKKLIELNSQDVDDLKFVKINHVDLGDIKISPRNLHNIELILEEEL